MTPDAITVVIPSIPPRATLLRRAVGSVLDQILPAAAVSVAVDLEHAGAAATRQRALDAVRTPFVAFLDDDDEMMPHHLAALMDTAQATGADYVYSYFVVRDPSGQDQPGNDPLRNFGRPFDYADPVQTTITTLVRTDLAQAVGFLGAADAPTPDGNRAGEDWAFTLGCVKAGAKIVHRPERTWWWHHHGRNTSGMPDRW